MESKLKRNKETVTNIANMQPQPPSPALHSASRTITLRIGSSRYEMTFQSEIREARKVPAILIQMPRRND